MVQNKEASRLYAELSAVLMSHETCGRHRHMLSTLKSREISHSDVIRTSSACHPWQDLVRLQVPIKLLVK